MVLLIMMSKAKRFLKKLGSDLWLLVRGGGGVGGRGLENFGGRAAIFWAPIQEGLKFSGPSFRGGLQFLGAFGRCARTIKWVLCYWNIKHCLKYDGRASNINRIAYSKLNRTVKKHSDWLAMSSDFTPNRFQFAWLWNGFESSTRFLVWLCCLISVIVTWFSCLIIHLKGR